MFHPVNALIEYVQTLCRLSGAWWKGFFDGWNGGN